MNIEYDEEESIYIGKSCYFNYNAIYNNNNNNNNCHFFLVVV